MANRILIKRSSTHNNIPGTGALSLGELAINTYDGRLFAKKDDGSASVIDLTRNDPTRILGDATSTYAWDQDTYTSNVTMTLNTVNANVGTYGENTNNVLKVPKITVNAKGLVTAVDLVEFSAAADLGTMSTQNSNNVAITGGSIDGTVIGATSAVDGTFANVTVNGTLYSNDLTATSISVAGDTTITGNLTVQGVTTTVNSTTVAIGDLNIELAKDATNKAQATGAGITVNLGSDGQATINYSSAGSGSWNLNKTTNVTGSFTVSSNTTLTGLLTANGGITADSGVFTVADVTGDIHTSGNLDVDLDTTLGGTLTVSDTTTLNDALTVNASGTFTGLLNADGGIAVNTDKFTVNSTNGNVATAGDLAVTGVTTLTGQLTANGGISADGGVFTVADTTGSVHTSGTLDVSGAATLGNNLSVTGRVTAGGVTGSAGAFGLVLANASNQLETDGDLTYNTSTDTLTIKNVSISGTASIAGLSSTGVSQTQVVYGGTGGAFKGEATFTYNESTDTLSVANASLTGNVSADGTLTVGGAATVGQTLGVTGNLSVATNKFTVLASNGNTNVAGTFNADGNATLGGTLDVTNNTTLGGTLGVTGNVAVNTNKFTITASNGNTGINGTLGVQGATTINNTMDVSGAASFAAAVTLTANVGATLSNYSTGTLKVLGDGSIDGVLQVSGAIYKAGYEVLNTTDTIDGGSF